MFSLWRTSLLSFLTVGSISAPAAEICPRPDLYQEAFGEVDHLSCDVLNGVSQFECPTCPDLKELRKFTKGCKSDEECSKGLRKFACTRSPWKGMNLRQRFEEFMDMANTVPSPFPKTVFACIAARETGYLDPVSITCSDLSGKTSQTGLGHMREETFLGLFGYAKPKTSKKPKTASETVAEEGRLVAERARIWKMIRGAAWLKPYNCGVSTDTDPVAFLRKIFREKYPRNALLQIYAMATLLNWNAGATGGTPSLSDKEMRKAVRDYNGNKRKLPSGKETRDLYSEKVMGCQTCFDQHKDPVTCLDISSYEKYSSDGKICD